MMNGKKKEKHTLNRAQALEKCKQMEKEILEAMESPKKYKLEKLGKKCSVDTGTATGLQHSDVVAKVKDWLNPGKGFEKRNNHLTKETTPLRNPTPKEMAGAPKIVGPQRAGTGISEVLKNAEKNSFGVSKNYLKEFGDCKVTKDPVDKLFSSRGIDLPKVWNPDLKPAASALKPAKGITPEKYEKGEDERSAAAGEESSVKAAAKDAERMKRMRAKEKRMALEKAREDWERSNEIQDKPQKPKGLFGDMFYVPVPENKRKPEEFKNNYNKYISKFEQKFRDKLNEKTEFSGSDEPFRSGYTCDPVTPQKASIKDIYHELLQDSQKKALLEKLKTDLRLKF